MNSEGSERIIFELKELSDNQKRTINTINKIDKQLNLHIQKTNYELREIRTLDAQQNEILDKHVEGVNTLKKMHEEQKKEFNLKIKEIEARINSLEIPKKVTNFIIKMFATTGVIFGTIYGLIQLFNYFKM